MANGDAVPRGGGDMSSSLARRASSPFNDLLDWLESSSTFGFATMRNLIRVEGYMDGDDYVLRAEMPGIDPDRDVDVTIEGDLLTIHGERREEERDKTHSEFRYGSFTRSLRLPLGAKRDEVAATYDAGVLQIRIPIGKPSAEATKIPVQRPG
jgi:HSP20 family molecular chaperone IbpA